MSFDYGYKEANDREAERCREEGRAARRAGQTSFGAGGYRPADNQRAAYWLQGWNQADAAAQRYTDTPCGRKIAAAEKALGRVLSTGEKTDFLLDNFAEIATVEEARAIARDVTLTSTPFAIAICDECHRDTADVLLASGQRLCYGCRDAREARQHA